MPSGIPGIVPGSVPERPPEVRISTQLFQGVDRAIYTVYAACVRTVCRTDLSLVRKYRVYGAQVCALAHLIQKLESEEKPKP